MQNRLVGVVCDCQGTCREESFEHTRLPGSPSKTVTTSDPVSFERTVRLESAWWDWGEVAEREVTEANVKQLLS